MDANGNGAERLENQPADSEGHQSTDAVRQFPDTMKKAILYTTNTKTWQSTATPTMMALCKVDLNTVTARGTTLAIVTTYTQTGSETVYILLPVRKNSILIFLTSEPEDHLQDTAPRHTQRLNPRRGPSDGSPTQITS